MSSLKNQKDDIFPANNFCFLISLFKRLITVVIPDLGSIAEARSTHARFLNCSSGHDHKGDMAERQTFYSGLPAHDTGSGCFHQRAAMFTLIQHFPASAPLALSTLLFLGSGSAQAQTASQPSNTNESACQATTSPAGGDAKDANLDGTYSACSLVNGFIGFGTRANDGKSLTPEFASPESGQVLNQPRISGRSHQLDNLLGQQDLGGSTGRLRAGSSSLDYRFDTRDFVAATEERLIDNAGYRGGRGIQGSGDDQMASLMTSSRIAEGAPAGGGVGSGGAGGGIDSGNNGGTGLTTPVAPAVPEPGTWAMLTAGLGLLAFAMRRKTGGKV